MSLDRTGATQGERLDTMTKQVKEVAETTGALERIRSTFDTRVDELKQSLDARVKEMQESNERKLEEMRQTWMRSCKAPWRSGSVSRSGS